jgi:prepilin-type N-terminal cleavage/methylation domain-containing protein
LPPGFTLMELVVAIVASAVLLAGLGSVMLIARQIAYTPAAAVHRLQAAEIFDELADELHFAAYVTDRSAHAIEFVVADRSGDGVPERIRYAWSGTAGDPLTKSVNGSTPAPVIDAVQFLQFTYGVDADTTTVATTSQTAETLLARDTNVSGNHNQHIRTAEWWAQRVDPAAFVSAPPANALGWKPTRVEFLGKNHIDGSECLFVQLRSTGDPWNGPTSQWLAGATLARPDVVDSPAWSAALLPSPALPLSLHRKYALVWAGVGDDIVEITTCDNASGGALQTIDGGASWQYLPTQQVYFRLYGTYTTPGPEYGIARKRLGNVQVVLQIGAQQYSRLETSIALANRPEILAAYWRTDFDHDPAADDVNGDSTADWQATDTTAAEVANPAPYDPDALVGGVWHASGKLSTQPVNDFAATTIAEVGFRDTVPGGSGAVVQINADWSGGQYSPLLLRVQMENDGTQTLRLASQPAGASEVVLFQHKGLPSSLVHCRLTILPNNNLVNIQVNNEDQGTYAYSTYPASGSDRVVSLFGDTSEAEFDYAEVRVLEAE